MEEKAIQIFVVNGDRFMLGERYEEWINLDWGYGIMNLERLGDCVMNSVKCGFDIEIIHGVFSDFERE